MATKQKQLELATEIMNEDREVLQQLAGIVDDSQWVDAIDGLCAPSNFKPLTTSNKTVLEKISAISVLSQGEHYLDTLSFIAGLMLELDGGLHGTSLTREIKHDRLSISVRFGKRI